MGIRYNLFHLKLVTVYLDYFKLTLNCYFVNDVCINRNKKILLFKVILVQDQYHSSIRTLLYMSSFYKNPVKIKCVLLSSFVLTWKDQFLPQGKIDFKIWFRIDIWKFDNDMNAKYTNWANVFGQYILIIRVTHIV